MNLFMLLKAYQIVYEIRRTFTLDPQMVCLLLFVADTVLNNRNQEHARTHTHKPDYSTQSKFFMVLRTVSYAFSNTTTT
jgi:hypothetical protein